MQSPVGPKKAFGVQAACGALNVARVVCIIARTPYDRCETGQRSRHALSQAEESRYYSPGTQRCAPRPCPTRGIDKTKVGICVPGAACTIILAENDESVSAATSLRHPNYNKARTAGDRSQPICGVGILPRIAGPTKWDVLLPVCHFGCVPVATVVELNDLERRIG